MTTPAITSSTGNPVTGNVVTLITTNAINQNTVGWPATMTNNSNRAYLRSGTTADWFDEHGAYTTSSTRVLIGTASSLGTVTGASSVSSIDGAETAQNGLDTGTTGYIWWRGYYMTVTRNGGEWPTNYSKLNWCGNSANPSFLNWRGAPAASTAPSTFGMTYDGELEYQTSAMPDGAWKDNRWYLVEWGLPRASGSGQSYLIVNNVLIDQKTTGGSQGPSGAAWWSMSTNLEGTSGNFSQDFYKSGNTWSVNTNTTWNVGSSSGAVAPGRIGPACMIELSSSATYNAGVKWQYPKNAMTETSVGFDYDDTGLGGTDRWVFITNSLNERSSAFQLNGTSGPVESLTIYAGQRSLR